MILRHAGQDATRAYSEVHDPLLLARTLAPEKLRGILDPTTTISSAAAAIATSSTLEGDNESKSKNAPAPLFSLAPLATNPTPPLQPHHHAEFQKPPLHTLLSAHDFETVAEKTLRAKTWAFYSSAATDLITHRANQSFFNRVWFRPRILRNVRTVSTACKIQGLQSALPLYVAPAALAKMVHPSGERGIAAACGRSGIIQCVSWERPIVFFYTYVFLIKTTLTRRRGGSPRLRR